uniref:Glutaredoxin and cysteine rich domain containing 2 n=1 Tax=Apteryx owenii TaxID=8824 RepID=A0A8B9PJB8_APTOW
ACSKETKPSKIPRKVRFKISSAYSGRVLKQVYEDGQELEPPAKERSRRLIRHSFEPQDHFCGAGETPEHRFYSPANHITLISTQALNGVRYIDAISRFVKFKVSLVFLCGRDTHKTLLQTSPILDFGKIIIYTNNLKIIRAPMDQKELVRRIIQTEGINDWAFKYRERKERFSDGHRKDVEKKVSCSQYVQVRENGTQHAERSCSQCKGSGSALCSLCHGSKFSMLANRFKESYRALRCPACNESGLQPCRICAA